MNNEKIIKLIEMSLADGVINEKEREIILRKAEALGEDIDEVEMYIEGKISDLESSTKTKTDNIKKCPSCGASIESFSARCSDCDYEFSKDASTSVVLQIQKDFEDLYLKCEKKHQKELEREINDPNYDPEDLEEIKSNDSVNFITTLPIPNTRVDILEFIALCAPLAYHKSNSSWWDGERINIVKKAWRSKLEQAIIKGRLTLKDDKQALEIIDTYAKKFKF